MISRLSGIEDGLHTSHPEPDAVAHLRWRVSETRAGLPCSPIAWLQEGSIAVDKARSTLVLVAHPGDETLGFSSVCMGADIVSVTDGGSPRSTTAFQQACVRLGGKQVIALDLAPTDHSRLPIEVLLGKLRELGPYER